MSLHHDLADRLKFSIEFTPPANDCSAADQGRRLLDSVDSLAASHLSLIHVAALSARLLQLLVGIKRTHTHAQRDLELFWHFISHVVISVLARTNSEWILGGSKPRRVKKQKYQLNLLDMLSQSQ